MLEGHAPVSVDNERLYELKLIKDVIAVWNCGGGLCEDVVGADNPIKFENHVGVDLDDPNYLQGKIFVADEGFPGFYMGYYYITVAGQYQLSVTYEKAGEKVGAISHLSSSALNFFTGFFRDRRPLCEGARDRRCRDASPLCDLF